MDLLEKAKTRHAEARAALKAVASDFEARVSELDASASADEVQAVIDEMQPKLSAAEKDVKRTKTQLKKLTKVADARTSVADMIPKDGEGVVVPDGAITTTEAPVYARENPHGPSFFSDLYRLQTASDRQALARLERSSNMTMSELEKRGTPFHDAEGRAMSSSTTAGGDFLPPLYFGDLYAEFKRARRVTSALVRNLPLAAKGNSITIPRITGGAASRVQTADNQNVQNTDATTAILTVPVCTVAGYVDLSRQIVERSEPGLDILIMEDLLKDYNKYVNLYTVNGTGSNGQPTGILVQGSTNSITYTSNAPTVMGIYSKIHDAVRQITESVFEETSCLVMTARRWHWLAAQVDSATAGSGRGLIIPNMQGPFNTLGVQNQANISGLDNMSPAGWIAGIPVYVDETIPKTNGVGTDQDVVFAMAANEHILWEDPAGPRQFTFEGVTSQTAAIRIQVFGYMAFTAGRYPGATSKITGTGLSSPTF